MGCGVGGTGTGLGHPAALPRACAPTSALPTCHGVERAFPSARHLAVGPSIRARQRPAPPTAPTPAATPRWLPLLPLLLRVLGLLPRLVLVLRVVLGVVRVHGAVVRVVLRRVRRRLLLPRRGLVVPAVRMGPRERWPRAMRAVRAVRAVRAAT